MSQPLRIEHLDTTLRAKGAIEAEHVLQLRRMMYAKGNVGHADAEILFKLDQACSSKHESFASLYVEALTDYFVWQSEPKGYVSPDLGQFLLENVTRDGHVAGRTELELLINVVHWARRVPEDLVTQVLTAVSQSVLLSRESVFGANRPRAAIGAADVAVLRKALHAPAGDGSLLVTRREADMLLTLNEKTQAGANDPAWRDFFVRAIANHLLNPMDVPYVPTYEDAARRDRWLDERGGVGELLSGIGQALTSGNIPFAQVWAEFDPTGAKAAKADAEAEAEATRRQLAMERVDATEAEWLEARMLADGTIDENERALLAFLKAEAQGAEQVLGALFARAGV